MKYHNFYYKGECGAFLSIRRGQQWLEEKRKADRLSRLVEVDGKTVDRTPFVEDKRIEWKCGCGLVRVADISHLATGEATCRLCAESIDMQETYRAGEAVVIRKVLPDGESDDTEAVKEQFKVGDYVRMSILHSKFRGRIGVMSNDGSQVIPSVLVDKKPLRVHVSYLESPSNLKVGDRVRVREGMTDEEKGLLWVDSMDDYCGEKGNITDITPTVNYRVDETFVFAPHHLDKIYG